MEKENEYVLLYDRIRILATLLVLIGHFTSLSMNEDHLFDALSMQGNLWMPTVLEFVRQFIYAFHMPLFVMLSGALFARSKVVLNKKFVVRRSKRLLLPFFVVAFFVLVPVRFLIGYYPGTKSGLTITLDILLCRDINYLWFLPMLFSATIVFCFLRCKTQLLEKHGIAILCVFVIISAVSAQFSMLPFALNRTMEFFLWFYLGMIFEQKRERLIRGTNQRWIGIIAVVLMVVLSVVLKYIPLNSKTITLGDVCIWGVRKLVVLLCSFLGCTASILLCASRERKSIARPMKPVLKNSFGIYLFHVPIGYVLRMGLANIVIEEYIYNAEYFFLTLVVAMTSLILSCLLMMFLRKLNISFFS